MHNIRMHSTRVHGVHWAVEENENKKEKGNRITRTRRGVHGRTCFNRSSRSSADSRSSLFRSSGYAIAVTCATTPNRLLTEPTTTTHRDELRAAHPLPMGGEKKMEKKWSKQGKQEKMETEETEEDEEGGAGGGVGGGWLFAHSLVVDGEAELDALVVKLLRLAAGVHIDQRVRTQHPRLRHTRPRGDSGHLV